MLCLVTWKNLTNGGYYSFRTELGSLRSERDKAVLEADFARDRLNGYMAEIDHQVLSFVCCYSLHISFLTLT